MMEEDHDDFENDIGSINDTNSDIDSEFTSPEETNAQIQQECLEKFSSQDFIMESEIFSQLERFFTSGGNAEQAIDLLSENYHATAQTVNILADLLIIAGRERSEVQSIVEDNLGALIVRKFDPQKVDAIFFKEGEDGKEGEIAMGIAKMIKYRTWRTLIYKLAEDYPECNMLQYAVNLITDAGFHGEITSSSTASQQLVVFSKILKIYIQNFLEAGEDKMEKNLHDLKRMICHGQHTYLYSQSLLQVLAQEPEGGCTVKRLSQEISSYAQGTKHNATPITMVLNGVAAEPRVCQALSAMLSKNVLNPSDITVLFKMYQAVEPPPVELIRVPQFLDLLMDSLFIPGNKINPDHKPKYIYLLAYAVSVHESYEQGTRKSVIKEELKTTIQAIEKAHTICSEKKGSSELLPEISTLYQCIRSPVIAFGVVRWVDFTVSEENYFKLSTENTPIHLVILDEVAALHNSLHQKVLELLIRLFELPQDLDVLVQLKKKKMLLDRMVHLLSCGYAVPVVNYIKMCFQRQETDISLIRHFVYEVLDIIAPPYSTEFVNLFLPLVENEEITGTMRTCEEIDRILKFIMLCK